METMKNTATISGLLSRVNPIVLKLAFGKNGRIRNYFSSAVSFNENQLKRKRRLSLSVVQLVEKPEFAVKVKKAGYNPFFDILHISYKTNKNNHAALYGTLIVYRKDGDFINDDQCLCMFPHGSFASSLYDVNYKLWSHWRNWSDGFSFIMYDPWTGKDWRTYNPCTSARLNPSVSNQVAGKAVCSFTWFNNPYGPDIFTPEHLTFVWKVYGNKQFMRISNKYMDSIPVNSKIHFAVAAFLNNTVSYIEPLSYDFFQASWLLYIADGKNATPVVLIYWITDKNGNKISRTYRHFINTDSTGQRHTYTDSLFLAGVCPACAVILPRQQCGFYGSIDELYSEFISWYKNKNHSSLTTGSMPLQKIEAKRAIDNELFAANEKQIDYSKFQIEVLNPNGEIITNALINSYHEFYCRNLIPGKKYFIVVSYDNIFVECLSFTCKTPGRVVYLSPAHMEFTASIEFLSTAFETVLKDKIINNINKNVPCNHCTKHALDSFIDVTQEGEKHLRHLFKIVALKTGMDFKDSFKIKNNQQ